MDNKSHISLFYILKTMIKFFRFIIQPVIILIILAIPVTFFNISGVKKTLIARDKTKESFNHDMGIQFAELKPLVEGQKAVGYITNKDVTSEYNDGQFLQAQYFFAPIVLDLNGKNNKYNIIDCTDQRSVIHALKETTSIPIKVNQYGKILSIKSGD